MAIEHIRPGSAGTQEYEMADLQMRRDYNARGIYLGVTDQPLKNLNWQNNPLYLEDIIQLKNTSSQIFGASTPGALGYLYPRVNNCDIIAKIFVTVNNLSDHATLVVLDIADYGQNYVEKNYLIQPGYPQTIDLVQPLAAPEGIQPFINLKGRIAIASDSNANLTIQQWGYQIAVTRYKGVDLDA